MLNPRSRVRTETAQRMNAMENASKNAGVAWWIRLLLNYLINDDFRNIAMENGPFLEDL